MHIGYSRVSTPDQNDDLQIDALEKAGCEKIYTEVARGARTDRPELEKLLSFVRAGDTVVVWKLDRLGRSIGHLIQTIEDLERKDVNFISLMENINTTTPVGKLTFHIFAALAEFEKDIIQERTKAGLEAARARGRKGGRPKLLSAKKVKMMQELYDSKKIPIADICRQFKISYSTFYRYIHR